MGLYGVIVVGVDAAERSVKALDHTIELTKLSGAELHIVMAYTPLSDHEVYERTRGLTSRQAANVGDDYDVKQLTHGASERARENGVDSRLHLIVGPPGNALVTVASEVGADLVVVGNRGMTGVRHVLGSVPNHVTHHARCSVLVVDTHEA